MEEREKIGRRTALKSVAVVAAVGAGAIVLGSGGLFSLLTSRAAKTANGTPAASSVTSNLQLKQDSPTHPNNASVFTSIKVVYFGMAEQSTGTRQEYLSLPAPAHFEDLLSKVRERHVVLGPMLTTMQIVINGNPVDGNPILNENDEVDFIPVFAGG